MKYELLTFQPGEAEAITGVSAALQRDWRHRGYLPSNKGAHARHTVFDLAKLSFLERMSGAGVGLGIAAAIADLAVAGIVYGALLSDAAFEGDSGHRGGPNRAVAVLREMSPSKVVKRGVLPAQYLIIWANGSEHWDSDVQSALNKITEADRSDKLAGPVTVFDQYSVGILLAKTAGRPLVRVEAETQ